VVSGLFADLRFRPYGALALDGRAEGLDLVQRLSFQVQVSRSASCRRAAADDLGRGVLRLPRRGILGFESVPKIPASGLSPNAGVALACRPKPTGDELPARSTGESSRKPAPSSTGGFAAGPTRARWAVAWAIKRSFAVLEPRIVGSAPRLKNRNGCRARNRVGRSERFGVHSFFAGQVRNLIAARCASSSTAGLFSSAIAPVRTQSEKRLEWGSTADGRPLVGIEWHRWV